MLVRVAAVAIVFLTAVRFGQRRLAVLFNSYDDEGYCLISLRDYFSGGHLYTQVFSQYGPFYFFAERALFALFHLPVTHDAGRFITLLLWLFSAALGGTFVCRVAKSLPWGLVAGVITMLAGQVLANEPNHPQQVVLPLLILGCCASTWIGEAGLAMMGAVGAALLFTKINVGVFYFEALTLTVVCGLRAGRLRKLCIALLLIFLTLFPLQLMHRDIPGWADKFALLAVLCGVSTFVAGLHTSPRLPGLPRSVLLMAGGALATALLITGGVMLQGMSLSTLLDGVVLSPLKHPGVFQIPLLVSRTQAVAGLLEVIGIAAVYVFRARWPASAWLIDVVRVSAAAAVLYRLVFVDALQPNLICLLPLGLLPPTGRAWIPSEYFPRIFVSSLAAAQFLQMYPVAGSQTFISYTPLLLWAVVSVMDGFNGLVLSLPAQLSHNALSGRMWQGAGTIPWCLVVFLTWVVLHLSNKLKPDPALASSLRGSQNIHLRPAEERMYEDLSTTIHANCSVLFTMPGMASLNFWSDVPTPNGFNLTAWMKVIKMEEQAKILDILRANPQACAVYNPVEVGVWQTNLADLNRLPLARYILYDMPKVGQYGNYEIHVSPNRTAEWVHFPEKTSRSIQLGFSHTARMDLPAE